MQGVGSRHTKGVLHGLDGFFVLQLPSMRPSPCMYFSAKLAFALQCIVFWLSSSRTFLGIPWMLHCPTAKQVVSKATQQPGIVHVLLPPPHTEISHQMSQILPKCTPAPPKCPLNRLLSPVESGLAMAAGRGRPVGPKWQCCIATWVGGGRLPTSRTSLCVVEACLQTVGCNQGRMQCPLQKPAGPATPGLSSSTVQSQAINCSAPTRLWWGKPI